MDDEEHCVQVTKNSTPASILLSIISLFAIASSAPAQPLYLSYFEAGAKLGNDFNMANGQLFLPTLQSDDQLLFLDLRAATFEPSGFEGNFGLGYRHITNSDWVFGAYAFIDRMRSANENYFTQTTFGLELMDEVWDFRANLYLPERGGKQLGPAIAQAAGGTIVLQSPEERAYEGTDVEIGYLLGGTSDGSVELRGFATGYHFARDLAGFKDISGGRTRLELRLYDIDWLGQGSRLMFGAQYQYDRVRGDVASGLLSVRIPLGPKQRRPMSRLQRRMINPIVRDPNIISNDSVRTELALDAETNALFGQVRVADANTANLSNFVASAGSLPVILDGQAGQINVNQSIVVQSGQTVRSAGMKVIGANTGRAAIFGAKATVNGTNAAQDVFVLSNNSTVRDLKISGGQNGVFGNNVSGFEVSNNRITGAQQSGLQLTGTVDGTIDSNTINANGVDGVTIGTFASGTISNNTMVNNLFNGLTVTLNQNGTISGNTANSNSNAGFFFTTFANGEFSTNVASNSTNNGIVIGDLQGGLIQDNQSTLNGGNGLRVTTLTNGSVLNNTLFDNNNAGLSINTLTAGTVSNNTATDNVGSGVFINNMLNGIVSTNTSERNGSNGFQVNNIGPGQFSNNTASQNGANGFIITNMNGGSLVDSNIANSNVDDGFNIGAGAGDWAGGDLSDNSSIGNGQFGFRVGTRTGGTATNNAAALNGADNTVPTPGP